MTSAELISLFILAAVAAWTPGPNNTLVANSGAKFGFRKTVPHISGIGIGFPFMIFCIALGLGAIFEQSLILREGLRIVGILVLLWISWKIATSGMPSSLDKTARPFTFVEAASFQWINPKAWVMVVSISTQFSDPEAPLIRAIILALTFVVAGFTSASGWTVFGAAMQKWLTTSLRAHLFNGAMALLLLFSVFLIATAELV